MKQKVNWKNVPKNIQDFSGFIYLIKNKTTNQEYIGRKYFWRRLTKRVNGKKTVVTSPSDWEYYTSSCTELNKVITEIGIESFDFLILECCVTRRDVIYKEFEHQVKNDVLTATLPNGDYKYYNGNILSKFFRPKSSGTPEYEAKCENISKSLKEGHASGKIVHPMKGKTHPSKGKKLPQTGHHKVKGKLRFNNGSINIVLGPDEVVPDGFVRGTLPHKVKRELKTYTLTCNNCYIEYSVPARQKSRKYCSDVCQQEAHSKRMQEKYVSGLVHINNSKRLEKVT